MVYHILVPKREPHPFWYNFSFKKRSSLLKPLKREKEPFYTVPFLFYTSDKQRTALFFEMFDFFVNKLLGNAQLRRQTFSAKKFGASAVNEFFVRAYIVKRKLLAATHTQAHCLSTTLQR